MKELFVGFDTSNYTTSIAICNREGKVLLNLKKLLPVSQGNVGLRQSDALFHHTKQLPELLQQLSIFLQDDYKIQAVGVSSKPRQAENSYMPCFLAGVSTAKSFSVATKTPLYEFSHQDGHIMAGLYSANKMELMNNPFIAFHVSGGTTDVLLVKPNENYYSVDIIGSSIDAHAGQMIDRIGVSMGLQFPCGVEMEKLANNNMEKIPSCKICVKNTECNLSGLQNLAEKLYKETQNKELTSAFVFSFIAKTLKQMLLNIRLDYPDIPCVFAGGVMSNKLIQKELSQLPNTYFSEPQFSSDNGAGIALLARHTFLINNGELNEP